MAVAAAGRSFAAVERFAAEIGGASRRAAYVLLGDETFLLEQCRRAVLRELVPAELREFCLHDLDLGETTIFDALDLAQTPSLMAPFQVLYLRGVKALYGRGAKKEEFAALEAYFRRPNPGALLIFVADHIHLPADVRTLDYQEKERAEKIRETLGDVCGVVELQAVTEDDAARWIVASAAERGVRVDDAAAHELADSLGSDMMTIASELEKLLLYAGARGATTLGTADVETMVCGAKQRSLFELTDAISQHEAPRALALLGGLLNASDGEDASIGHVFMLAKTFRQLLVLSEKQVRDQRGMWAALWPGFRVAPHAADQLIAQARRYRDRGELMRGLRWIAKADVELRSSPPDKRLVLERLVLRLCGAGVGAEEAQGV